MRRPPKDRADSLRYDPQALAWGPSTRLAAHPLALRRFGYADS